MPEFSFCEANRHKFAEGAFLTNRGPRAAKGNVLLPSIPTSSPKSSRMQSRVYNTTLCRSKDWEELEHGEATF